MIVKRCQDIVRKQQEEKEELTKKLKAAEESLTAAKEVKDLDLDASVGTVWRRDVQKRVMTYVKPSTLSGISVLGLIVSFVIGFILGQLASHFIK